MRMKMLWSMFIFCLQKFPVFNVFLFLKWKDKWENSPLLGKLLPQVLWTQLQFPFSPNFLISSSCIGLNMSLYAFIICVHYNILCLSLIYHISHCSTHWALWVSSNRWARQMMIVFILLDLPRVLAELHNSDWDSNPITLQHQDFNTPSLA